MNTEGLGLDGPREKDTLEKNKERTKKRKEMPTADEYDIRR